MLTFLAAILPAVFLPALQSWLESNNNIETTRRKTALATIEERREAYRHRAETIQAAMHHRPFWIVWSLFAVPLGIWWAVVVFDSIFLFSGNIPDLPDSIRPWAEDIFASIFLSGGGVAGATLIAKGIAAKR